jgi:ubiquinol-cytochrome c reductase cytochrome b subunit
MHLMVLHINGSGNPLGIKTSHIDTSTFHPYYTTKDFFGIIIFFMIFSYFVFFNPNILGHPDNYIPASPLKTPTHIVPE